MVQILINIATHSPQLVFLVIDFFVVVFIFCSGSFWSCTLSNTVFSNDSHFHLLSLLICNPHFFSLKLTEQKRQQSMEVLDQDLMDDNCENGVNVDLPLRNANNEGQKSNKCNQCNYASSQTRSLRRHLKMHNGENSNKCNQCDYASFRACHLKEHLKIHSGEKLNKCNQCDYASAIWWSFLQLMQVVPCCCQI